LNYAYVGKTSKNQRLLLRCKKKCQNNNRKLKMFCKKCSNLYMLDKIKTYENNEIYKNKNFSHRLFI